MFIAERHVKRGTLTLRYLAGDGQTRTRAWVAPSAEPRKRVPNQAPVCGDDAGNLNRVRFCEFFVDEGHAYEGDWYYVDNVTFTDEVAEDLEGCYERNLVWNLMSDGTYVSACRVGTARPQNFSGKNIWAGRPDFGQHLAPGSVTFDGVPYECRVTTVGTGKEYLVDERCPSSDYYKYIVSSGDEVLDTWDYGFGALYEQSDYYKKTSLIVERVSYDGPYVDFMTHMAGFFIGRMPLEGWGGYTSVGTSPSFSGGVPGSNIYQRAFGYTLAPKSPAPVITPDVLDQGRMLGEDAAISGEIATDAVMVVSIDGQLAFDCEVSKGEFSISISELWDALAPGWHDVFVEAKNEDGYRAFAKRTFIKAFGVLLTGHERDGMDPKYLLYSRWGQQLEEMQPYDVTHRQEINGEDSLDFSLDEVLAKGDRILWNDGHGWREHAVVGIDQSHDTSESASYHCETTMMGDLDAKQLETFSASGTCAQSLSSLLQGTLWSVGTVDVEGVKSAEWEKRSAYEILMEMAGLYGAEVYPSLECDVGGVAYRRVNMVQKMGEDNGARFEYASNLEGIDKQVLDDPVYTAVRCYGAEGVTAYVQNEEAKLLWGLPDGRGGTMHTWGRFEDSSIESASELMEAGKEWLEKRMTPQVSYTSRIPFAELEGVQLGDTVQVRDSDFTPTLRIFARVGAMERDLSAGTTSSVTFGNVVSVLPDVLARQYDSIRVVSTALNDITPESMMAGMNALYASGGSYVCMTAEGGIITANVPLNSDGSPTTTDGALSAVQMSAGSIRTATEVDDSGQWVWNDVQLSGSGGTQ